MSKLPEEKELQALTQMAKDFEAQMREQSEIARKIAIECEKIINKEQDKYQAK